MALNTDFGFFIYRNLLCATGWRYGSAKDLGLGSHSGVFNTYADLYLPPWFHLDETSSSIDWDDLTLDLDYFTDPKAIVKYLKKHGNHEAKIDTPVEVSPNADIACINDADIPRYIDKRMKKEAMYLTHWGKLFNEVYRINCKCKCI